MAVRFGILGAGRIATTALAPAFGWAHNAELCAIASRDLDRAKRIAKDLSVAKSYGSYDALIDDPEIDAIYIGLPNGLHARWAMRALSAGKHVLCEKSLTFDAEGARALSLEAKTRGLRLVEAFMYRHHPQWSPVRTMVRENAVGDLRSIRAWLTGAANADDQRFDPKLGGGALYDVTCYGVNVARFLLEREPVRVAAAATERVPGVDESTSALLTFDGGVLATVSGSLTSDATQGVVLTGTRGSLEISRPFIPGWDETEVVLVRDGRRSVIRGGGANHFLHMVEHFAQLVLDSSQVSEPAEDGAANVRVCDAIRESYSTSRGVDLAPIATVTHAATNGTAHAS